MWQLRHFKWKKLVIFDVININFLQLVSLEEELHGSGCVTSPKQPIRTQIGKRAARSRKWAVRASVGAASFVFLFFLYFSFSFSSSEGMFHAELRCLTAARIFWPVEGPFHGRGLKNIPEFLRVSPLRSVFIWNWSNVRRLSSRSLTHI